MIDPALPLTKIAERLWIKHRQVYGFNQDFRSPHFDAFRHALGASILSYHFGRDAAMAIGDQRESVYFAPRPEWVQKKFGTSRDTRIASVKDMFNNRDGGDIGEWFDQNGKYVGLGYENLRGLYTKLDKDRLPFGPNYGSCLDIEGNGDGKEGTGQKRA